MKIFVTGASSFIGSELIRQSVARGIEVIGIDSRDSVEWIKADIRDRAIADLIPVDVDAVIHLAALSRDPDCRNRAYECFDVNVMGTLNLIDAAEMRRARQFIFASSEWVYDKFTDDLEKTEDDIIDAAELTSEYAFSKYVCEVNLRQKCRHGFRAATVLRFGIVYGSRFENWSAVEALFNAVATRDEVSVGSLATARRFLHVSDVARGILASVGHPDFSIFNIEGNRLVSLGDVISTSAALLKRTPTVIETAKNAPSIRAISGAKAERILGWTAETSLESGLRQLATFLSTATQ